MVKNIVIVNMESPILFLTNIEVLYKANAYALIKKITHSSSKPRV